MIRCDNCQKKLSSSNRNYIEVWLYGKYGDYEIKIHGDRHLVFCSLKCYSEFNFQEKPKKELKNPRCYLDRRRKCYYPEEAVVCKAQLMICSEMKPERGEWHKLLKESKQNQLTRE